VTLASTSGNSSAARTATTPLESTPDGTCLELGSGTGLFTPLLDSAFEWAISVDLAEQMLRQAPGRSPLRVRADASALPADDVAAALPGQWHAVEAQAGWGSWAVLRRRV
jgi:ubiquinone/menaquinone biosynthesis C-methylase UbiE